MGGKLIQPKDALQVVSLDLHPGRPSKYMRELLRAADITDENGLLPAARWLMGLRLGGKSDYLENKDLDHNLGKTSFTMPTNVYLALCTVVPEDSKTGITITEASYTGYARKQVKGENLNAAASGKSTNSAELIYAACTAGSSTIIGWALCDNATKSEGNMLYWGSATSTVISTTQTPPTIAVNGLEVTED